MKLRRKKSKEDNIFCDKEFAQKMNVFLDEIL
jgi:hypothetical protein